MTAQTPPAYHEYLAQRFSQAFEAFVAEVHTAVDAGILDPARSSTPALLMWQTEALPQLEQEQAKIQNAYAVFKSGETGPLTELARSELGLAKQLDGFPLDFSGSDRAQTLDQLETAVVSAAYRLYSTVGIH
jgi:hypothetical protein